jgi:hypothetical protein
MVTKTTEKKADKFIRASVSMSRELYADIEILAGIENRSISNYIETELTKIRDKAKKSGALK